MARQSPQLGWPYHRSELDVRRRLPKGSKGDPIPSGATLVSRSVLVLFWNGLIVYGVLNWDWDAVTVILLFLAEAWIALATDVARVALPWTRSRLQFDETDGPVFPWAVLSFEIIFIAFFSMFCLLGLAPGTDLVDTAGNARQLVLERIGSIHWPVLVVVLFQLEQLVRDFLAVPAPGQSRAIHLRAGGWMFLIFFSVMTYPLGEFFEFSPTVIAFIMLGLKTLGQMVGVWAVPMAVAIPDSD